jgi:hypothetical protein
MTPSRPQFAASARWYVAILLFLFPIKFGGVIGLGDEAFFPLDGWQWAFFVWPPFLVSFLAAVSCVLVFLAHPGPVAGKGRWPVVAWSVLVFAVLPGLAGTTEWDYALTFVSHLASAAVFALAVRRLLAHDPAARGLLAVALAASTIWCCISGVRQRFGGLEEFQVAAEEMAEASGQALDSGLLEKMRQTRVYGTFQIANLYAAHLILVAPLMLVLLWRAGGRFEPTRISRPLLAGLGALLFLGPLYWSGSRGAVLGLAGGVALGALALPSLRRWRIPIVLWAIILGLGLMFAVGRGRDLLSASSRMQYYRSAALMFRAHPLLGAGLGEFYPEHLRLRPLGSEPTRMPHSFPIGVTAQAGLLAGVAALACLLIPLWLALAEDGERRAERLALIVGLGAWSLHSLIDLNIQVPGTVLTAVCLPFLAIQEGVAEAATPDRWRLQTGGRIAQILLVTMALAGVWRLPGERAFQKFDYAVQTQQPLAHVWQQGRAAARLLPTNSNPDRILARVAEATGNGPGAVEAYERAVRRSPHRAALWAALARARLAAGDLEGAGSAMVLAVEWNPGFPRYQAHLAMVRALRQDESPAPERAALTVTALTAEYHLETSGDLTAMNVRLAWPADLPPPRVPLERVAAWLTPHAGVFPAGNLPVRFHPDATWTNAN